MGNKNMNKAKKAKNDEFYTQITDIEKEMRHYRDEFKDKVIYCNCDDPEESNFWKFFKLNFDFFGLKKLISTHYDEDKSTYKLEYDGKDIVQTALEQNGDFRNPESIELLKKSDIIITNPPFSLFREYVAQLIEYEKDFIIIGNMNAVTYKEIFPLLKENKMWLGNHSGTFEFEVPMEFERKNTYIKDSKKYAKFGNITWYTNLNNPKRNEEIILYETYSPEKYPKYDNYDAINVDRVAQIPQDYDGIMGVPITFMTKYNPEQFEILGSQRWGKDQELLNVYIGEVDPPENDKKTTINGRETYDRIFIKRKK